MMQQNCTASKRNICQTEVLLLGIFAGLSLFMEFILTASLMKVGQMVKVLSNVFISRPHTTNGYLLEQ